MDVFVDWFNGLWKRPPNLIAAGRDEQKYGPRITASLDLFESLLAGREYLFGDFGAADIIAFPFLKYAVLWDEGDEQEFHRILQRWLPIDGQPARPGVDPPRARAPARLSPMSGSDPGHVPARAAVVTG